LASLLEVYTSPGKLQTEHKSKNWQLQSLEWLLEYQVNEGLELICALTHEHD